MNINDFRRKDIIDYSQLEEIESFSNNNYKQTPGSTLSDKKGKSRENFFSALKQYTKKTDTQVLTEFNSDLTPEQWSDKFAHFKNSLFNEQTEPQGELFTNSVRAEYKMVSDLYKSVSKLGNTNENFNVLEKAV